MDELQQYLKNFDSQKITIGDNDCNLLLVGYEQNSITEIKVILLTVGLNEISEAGTAISELRQKYLTDPTFKNLFDRGKHLAESTNIKFVMAAYNTNS